jgi:alpha/beta superfamily hydrolase
MGAAATRVLLDGPAGRIEVASALPEAPRAIAVIAHPHPLFGGTMDNKVITTLARAYTDAGMAALRFNFRGVGATEGTHDEGRGETEDMLAVIEYARRTLGDLPLHLAGFSFGGAIALRSSGRVDFTQLILVAPGFRRILAHGMDVAPDPADPDLGAPGRHHTTNTLVVHGDLDDTAPLADSLAWATAREVPMAIVPGGEHFFHRKLHVLREIVVRWIR